MNKIVISLSLIVSFYAAALKAEEQGMSKDPMRMSNEDSRHSQRSGMRDKKYEPGKMNGYENQRPMSAEEKAKVDRWNQMTPEQREQTMKEYKMKYEDQMRQKHEMAKSKEVPNMSPEDKAMYEKLMQMPPEQREQAMRQYKEKRMREGQSYGESMRPTEEDKRQMTAEDKAMYEKVMQMPPEQREAAGREYREKKMAERRRGGESMGPTEEEKKQMSAEDKAMYEKVMRMPPEQREAAGREYREKRMAERQKYEESGYSKEHERSQMTPEDKAMYEKLMQMPPEQREKAAQEYRAKRQESYK